MKQLAKGLAIIAIYVAGMVTAIPVTEHATLADRIEDIHPLFLFGRGEYAMIVGGLILAALLLVMFSRYLPSLNLRKQG